MRSAISEFEKVLSTNLSSQEELLEILSENFSDKVAEFRDAQVAFNELDFQLKGLLNKYCCYTLSKNDEKWHVGTGENYKKEKEAEYKKIFEKTYQETFDSLEDMISKLESRVLKDMSNAGCDCKSALRMILEEDLLLEGVFEIVGADADPAIEFVN